MISVAYIWIIIAIVCFFIELITPTFAFMSISFGAIFGWLTSLITNSLLIQLIVFFIAFLIFFIKLKPLIYKKDHTKFNTDLLIGNIVIANSTISESEGTVKMNGSIWQARCNENTTIDKDERIIIVQIDGNKLIVTKENR
ncbi:MAG: NfeD family protein [Spirochaetaceae bacterium]|nr:NfeD family protein [Spirochaetaceae bacterium]